MGNAEVMNVGLGKGECLSVLVGPFNNSRLEMVHNGNRQVRRNQRLYSLAGCENHLDDVAAIRLGVPSDADDFGETHCKLLSPHIRGTNHDWILGWGRLS